MPLFRCLNCARDFEAAKPACAPCGIDPEQFPRDAGIVIPLVVHHFDPPGRRPGVGLGHAACDPKLRVGRPGMAFTGEPGAVNCAACKATELYAAAGGTSTGVSSDLSHRTIQPLDAKGG